MIAEQPEEPFTGSNKTVGIVGLGLIGGSFARAYHKADWTVYAYDTDDDTMDAARVDVVNGELDNESLGHCDLVILAAYPNASLLWLQEHAFRLEELARIGHAPLIIDTAGTKTKICSIAFRLAAQHGFTFCGAHPMAGTEHSGYARSRADLFQGAPMVLVPAPCADRERLDVLDTIHQLLAPARFGSFSVTTPEEHDRIIAFTSQLAHVVSNAYVKSPTAQAHVGFSAGSYKDLTRVAHLNPAMWSELMIENARPLSTELDGIIRELGAYRDALAHQDRPELERLLAEGDRIKRDLDDTPQTRR